MVRGEQIVQYSDSTRHCDASMRVIVLSFAIFVPPMILFIKENS